jgi:hypothetical protein
VVNKNFDLLSYKVKDSLKGISFDMKLDVSKFFNNPFIYDLKNDPKDIHNEFEPIIKQKILPNMLGMFSIENVKAD